MVFTSNRRKGGGELVQKVRQTTEATESSCPGGASQFLASSFDDVAARNLPAAYRAEAPEHTTIAGVTYQATQPCADAFISEVSVSSGVRNLVSR